MKIQQTKKKLVIELDKKERHKLKKLIKSYTRTGHDPESSMKVALSMVILDIKP